METQISISNWALKTFGPPQSARQIVERFLQEVDELDKKSVNPATSREQIKDECADCLVVLYQVAAIYGFDLIDAVEDKMQINRSRRWNTRGDGIGQHI